MKKKAGENFLENKCSAAAFYVAVFLILFFSQAISSAALAQTEETILKTMPKDAAVILYSGDIHDFQNYAKWSPIYDYVVSEEFGGIYLTEKGKAVTGMIEKAIKMPLTQIPDLIKDEIVMWLDTGDFRDKSASFAAAFRSKDMNKIRSIIDDNFIENKSDVKSEKLPHSDYSYFVKFKFKNPAAEFLFDSSARKNSKLDFIEGSFAFCISGDAIYFSSGKEYLQKTIEYSRSQSPETPVFLDYLSQCRAAGRSGFFINFETIISAGMKSLKEGIAELKNDKKSGEKNKDGAAPAEKAAQLEILQSALETLGVAEIKYLSASHELTDGSLVMHSELKYAKESPILKFAGPDIDYASAAALCPADASSFVSASADFTAIIEAIDAVFEKMPLGSRAQYFMAKSAVLSSTGMKLKEDIIDMLSGQMIMINKISKDKAHNLWIARPTFILKLKNPKTAEKLMAKLVEQKLMANFEVKEYMGKKYFSAPIPGGEKQSVSLAICGDYLVFSMSFDHFTSVLRNISEPQNTLAGLDKFKKAAAGLNPKALYFIYTSDEDLAEYYIENNFMRDPGGRNAKNELIDHYSYDKINWEKVRRRQAPTAGAIYREDNSFKVKVAGGFKRD
ncbi:MAG: hypothetical protein BWY32_03678 [bacterium ADurb.Bin243]|nr:MAG: hypothetical protein BWY32_03678 [bacterium ADurb.Bin243]